MLTDSQRCLCLHRLNCFCTIKYMNYFDKHAWNKSVSCYRFPKQEGEMTRKIQHQKSKRVTQALVLYLTTVCPPLKHWHLVKRLHYIGQSMLSMNIVHPLFVCCCNLTRPISRSFLTMWKNSLSHFFRYYVTQPWKVWDWRECEFVNNNFTQKPARSQATHLFLFFSL